MSKRTYRTFQALILGALGLFLLFKVSDGRILFYINQRFVLLVLLAAIGLILLAQVVMRDRPPVEADEASQPEDHDHTHDEHNHPNREGWALWLVALPLLVGLLLPDRALGTSALANRGINTGAGQPAGASDLSSGANLPAFLPPAQRSVYDWVQVFNQGAMSEGEPADVTGFVYHDPRLPASTFLIGRFTIACCVADASAYGVAVSWPQSADLPDNRWVRARGTVHMLALDDGRTIPVIDAEQVEEVPEPVQPYLFP